MGGLVRKRDSSNLNRDLRLVNERGMIDLASFGGWPTRREKDRAGERCPHKMHPRATFMATEASILVSPAGYLAHLPPPWRNVGEKGGGARGMGRSGLRRKKGYGEKGECESGYVTEKPGFRLFGLLDQILLINLLIRPSIIIIITGDLSFLPLLLFLLLLLHLAFRIFSFDRARNEFH